MRKAITFGALFLALGALRSHAQYTKASASLGSACYNNGSVTANWVNGNPTSPVQPNIGGGPFPQSVPGAIDASGNFTLTLGDVHQIQPNQPTLSSWNITACSKGGLQPACYTANVPVTGATMDVSSYFSGAPSACTGTGVTRIIAGTNVTVTPSGGTGVVTVNSTGGGGGSTITVNGGGPIGSPTNLKNSSGAGQIDVTNPSGNDVEFAVHNTTTQVNGVPCPLGGTCNPSNLPAPTFNPAGVCDGGSGFSAALNRYDNNQPPSLCVAPATSALGALQFGDPSGVSVNPQYAEQTINTPPNWAASDLSLNFYSSATTGSAEWEVETSCTPANTVVGSPTWSSPLTVTTPVSSTPNGAVTTAVISNIAQAGVNGCPATNSTPSIMTYRVFRAPSDGVAAPIYLIGTTLYYR